MVLAGWQYRLGERHERLQSVDVHHGATPVMPGNLCLHRAATFGKLFERVP